MLFQLLNSSAILFHFYTLDSEPVYVPPQRHPDQFYVFYTQEPPPYSGKRVNNTIGETLPSNFFNLTSTYRSDSDVPVPYDRFVPINKSNFNASKVYSWAEVEAVVARKNKTAVWFVSNCQSSSGRNVTAQKLSEKIQLDQFGRCNGRECDRNCEAKILRKFSFNIFPT